MGVKNIDPEVEEDMYAFAQEYLPKHGFINMKSVIFPNRVKNQSTIACIGNMKIFMGLDAVPVEKNSMFDMIIQKTFIHISHREVWQIA